MMENGRRVRDVATGECGTVVDWREGEPRCADGCCGSPDMVAVRLDNGSPVEWIPDFSVEDEE
jgi:hypothetical protein